MAPKTNSHIVADINQGGIQHKTQEGPSILLLRPPSVTLRLPPWILKRVGLESSGQRLISLNKKKIKNEESVFVCQKNYKSDFFEEPNFLLLYSVIFQSFFF